MPIYCILPKRCVVKEISISKRRIRNLHIALDTIEKAYKSGIESKSDIVYYGYNIVDSDGKVTQVFKPEVDKLIYTGKEVTGIIFPELISPDCSKEKKMNLMLVMRFLIA